MKLEASVIRPPRPSDAAAIAALLAELGYPTAVEAVEGWAREQRAHRVTVASGLARAEAHAFYERLGYEHTARRYSRLLQGAAG